MRLLLYEVSKNYIRIMFALSQCLTITRPTFKICLFYCLPAQMFQDELVGRKIFVLLSVVEK